LKNVFLKKEKMILVIAVAVLFLGVLTGALYMAHSETDSSLYEYLNNFFETFCADENRFSIFKNALADNLKIVIIITLCGFFKFGTAGVLAVLGIKGFVSGFTTAAFVRYYAMKGLLVPLASLVSSILFIPALVLFSTYAVVFSLKKKNKNDIGIFLLCALLCFTIFCVVSFFDGYVTTIFMKLFRTFIVKM